MWADEGLRRWARVGIIVLALFVLANCASAPENDPEALAEHQTINDPIESANRMTRPVWLADRKYSDVTTSGLSAQVVVNPSDGAYDFDLKRGDGSR